MVLASTGLPYAQAHAATPAEQRIITRNAQPRPVPPLATAQVQGDDLHAKAQPVNLSAFGLQAAVKVADKQPCPANSLLLGKDENPTAGQTCRVATLEVNAPEHPVFIQTLGSLMAEDSPGLMDLHLSLYQLAPNGQKNALPQVMVSGYTGGALLPGRCYCRGRPARPMACALSPCTKWRRGARSAGYCARWHPPACIYG